MNIKLDDYIFMEYKISKNNAAYDEKIAGLLQGHSFFKQTKGNGDTINTYKTPNEQKRTFTVHYLCN